MNRTVSRAGATIFKGVAIAWLAAVALWVLFHYGADGLFGAAILALVAFVSVRLGGWDSRHGETESEPPRLGPTTEQLYGDPTYNAYAGNAFHKLYHGKK